MRITVIGPSYPYRGGIALFTNRIAEALAKEGNEVSIVTFKLQYPSFLFPGETQFSSVEKSSSVPIHQEINSINPFNWIRVARKIKNDNPDLVIFKYWMPFMAPCFGTIARLLGKSIKKMAIVHNLIPHERHLLDQQLTMYFLKPIDSFIVMSKSVLSDLTRLDTVKPKLFSPHPLYDNFGEIKSKEEALKSLGLSSTYSYMLFFGIIRKYKGLDLLLKAFGDTKLNDETIKLIIAGEFYEDSSSYMELIKKHNLQDSVILKNQFIPDDEVVNYFCAADIVVQPYKHATQSGVTQIAYHFNKPILVTDVGGLKEIIPNKKVGYVVEPNERAIKNALLDFFQNNRSSEFIDGVKKEKQKYSWQKMTEAIISLYKKC